MENCRLFAKKINCDLNDTTQECEDTKVSFTKYCSSKECQGLKLHYAPCLVYGFKNNATHACDGGLLKRKRKR